MSAPAEFASTLPEPRRMRLFLCGDVMIGRGIDQVLAHPCDPALHEGFVRSAVEYVRLAEEANGPVPRRVGASYVWGVALDELLRARPDVRLINLETSITRSNDFAPKGINYRVSPENAACLTAAAIDCCALANNHVLDWGRAGLLETLDTLARLRIKTAGAGRNSSDAAAPALLEIPRKGRVLVFSLGMPTSGIPESWAATAEHPGVFFLSDLGTPDIAVTVDHINRLRQPGDVIVVSIHWGSNWGYRVPRAEQKFAHALIDQAGVSIVHGHSSHHAKGVEVYRNRLILYGCGDFLNDYEGIRGYEEYRSNLHLMYFADIDAASADLIGLEIVPLQMRNFRLVRPTPADVDWLRLMLHRESEKFVTRVEVNADGRLVVSWPAESRSRRTASVRT